jgi:hypothetical protein
MNRVHGVAAAALLLIATGSHAARPTSIEYTMNGQTPEGIPFARYTVSCNDGRKVPVTAWDDRSKWCLDETGTGNCMKKQLAAVRAACADVGGPQVAGAH